jgi:hypothetical protein
MPTGNCACVSLNPLDSIQIRNSLTHRRGGRRAHESTSIDRTTHERHTNDSRTQQKREEAHATVERSTHEYAHRRPRECAIDAQRNRRRRSTSGERASEREMSAQSASDTQDKEPVTECNASVTASAPLGESTGAAHSARITRAVRPTPQQRRAATHALYAELHTSVGQQGGNSSAAHRMALLEAVIADARSGQYALELDSVREWSTTPPGVHRRYTH